MLRIGAKKELFLWKRKRGFSIDFLKGFLLALGFHLALFFGLRINSPPNLDTSSPITPVSVEIDLGMPLKAPSPTHITFLPMERIKPPRLLEMPPTRFTVEVSECRKARIHEPDFSEIEKIAYELLKNLDDDD